MNTKIIKFNLNQYKLYEKIKAKQGDTKSRFLLFQLFDGSLPFSLENRSVRAYMIKPDKNEVFNDLIINDKIKGYCTLELTNQVLAAPGTVKIELMVTEGDRKLTSSIFELDVEKSINSEKSIVSTNEFTALLNGLASLNEYDNYKNELKDARGGQSNLNKRLDEFDEHLETIVTDTTAKFSGVENKKADKTELEIERQRINSFTSLEQGSTTGDAELIDGRIGVDGKTYINIGGAIRGQVKSTKESLTYFLGVREIQMTHGYNINLSAGVGNIINLTPEKVSGYSYAIVNCTEGNKFTINGTGGVSPRLYGFLDSNNILLSVSSQNTTGTNLILTAPKNSAKIVINDKSNSISFIGESKTNELQTNISKEQIVSSTILDNNNPITMNNGSLIGLGNYSIGDIVNLTPESNSVYKHAIVDCTGVYNFTVSASGGNNARAWGFLDSENKLISRGEAEATYSHIVLPVPHNAKRIVINTKKDSVSYVGSTSIGVLKKDVDGLKTSIANTNNNVAILNNNVAILNNNVSVLSNDVDDLRKEISSPSTYVVTKRFSIPAPSLQIGTGSPSLMVSSTGDTKIPYWSMSGTSTWQTLTGYVGDLGVNADGIEISMVALGTGEPVETDYDVFSVITSSLVDFANVDSNKRSSNPVIYKTLPQRVTSRRVLETFVPIDTSNPMFVSVRRIPEDVGDTWTNPMGVVALEIKPVNVPKPITVQEEIGYNTWPFVTTLGNKVICLYSKGVKHGGDSTRYICRKVSYDEGKTWSNERKVIDTLNLDDAVVGKGKSSNGDTLLWVRGGGVEKPSLHLYKSSDGDTYTLVTSPSFSDVPYHIGDIFFVPTVGLMAFYNGGGYNGTEPTKTWGIVTSSDDGVTWVQRTIETGLDRNDWGTEITGAYIGDGRILAIGRNESSLGTTQQAQFQLQSSDYGSTWTRKLTNITDVRASTSSMIYNEIDKTVSLYYFQRAMGVLRSRKANVSDIWDKPMDWSPSNPLAIGTNNISDTGNANAISIGDSHIVAYYSGDNTNTGIYAVVVEQ